MNWSDAEKKEKRHQEDLDRLRGFRPMDDTFMRGLFKENLPLAELVLRIITYVIFITENDYYKAGEPVYTIQNMNLTLNRPFNDGAHILYVNGEYRDDSEIGRLMHDFNCTSADEMNFELLAERTRYLKENPKGVSEMCKVMEDLRVESYTEGREEQARMMAQKLYRKGYSIEEIADMVEYSTEKVEEWLTPKAG